MTAMRAALRLASLPLAAAPAALISTAAQAGASSPARLAEFAKLPDWSGLWETDRDVSGGTANAPKGYADTALITLAAKPPYNATWEAAIAERAKTDKTMAPALKVCSFGFPGMMGGPHTFELLVTPEETLIIAHDEEVRHVYTKIQHLPADVIWPTPMGESIGRWEGDTLVIDTIAREEGPVWTNRRYPISEKAHFVERLRMIDHDHIEDQMTISDPTALRQDWKLAFRYRRVKDLDRLLYESCTGNDRNVEVNGQLTIAPEAPKK